MVGLFEERAIRVEIWNRPVGIGEERTKQKESYVSSEYLTDNSHEIGLLGEWAFGTLVGLTVAEDIDPFGDEGFYFAVEGVKIDVKATKYYHAPWLKVRVEKVFDGHFYPLIAINVDRHIFRYCGYADAAMLRKYEPERLELREDFKAEKTGLRRDPELGPPSHVIRNRFDLYSRLPPISKA